MLPVVTKKAAPEVLYYILKWVGRGEGWKSHSVMISTLGMSCSTSSYTTSEEMRITADSS